MRVEDAMRRTLIPDIWALNNVRIVDKRKERGGQVGICETGNANENQRSHESPGSL
jgi:hypothetical protein